MRIGRRAVIGGAALFGLASSAAADAPLGAGRVTLEQFGAVGDGVTDDGPALRAALGELGRRGGGQLQLGSRSYRVVLGGGVAPIPVSDFVTIAGAGDALLVVESDETAMGKARRGHRGLFNLSGAGIEISGLTIRRADDRTPMVILNIGACKNLSVSRLVFDGAGANSSSQYCHGIIYGHKGASESISISECQFTRLSYGLLMTNDAAGSVSDLRISKCLFSRNLADDIALNAPNGRVSNVVVDGCVFEKNRSLSPSGGFAVSLANIASSKILNCKISDYGNEAIHIEDFSRDILIKGNVISRAGTDRGAYIRVMSGSRNVQIVENKFMDVGNPSINVLEFLSGSVGKTPSGGISRAPSGVTVRGNTFSGSDCRYWIYMEHPAGYDISNNVLYFSARARSKIAPAQVLLFRDGGGAQSGNLFYRNGKRGNFEFERK